MRVVRTPRFDRAYNKVPLPIQSQAIKQLLLLEENPHHPSLRTHKRRGEEGVWQARITRDYRVYFLMESDTITLLDIGPHEK